MNTEVLKYRKIKVGKKNIDALSFRLVAKNLIVLRGNSGYIMCGYLNLKVANKFKEVACKVVGVATIHEALKAKVFSCSYAARRLGIYKGQAVKEVLRLIA